MKEVKDMVNFLWSHEFSVLGYFDKLGLEFPKHKKDLEAFIKDNFQARILVRDEGRGIPPGLEKQIFEKFFRVPGTPAGGLGLGLSIVSNVIELHGGRVLARNRVERQGTVFEILLPLKAAPAALQEAMR